MADTPKPSTNGQNSAGLLPAGLSDLMPEDARREAEAIALLMAGFARFGYARVQPPLVEFEETLLAEGPGAALSADTFRLMDPQTSRMMALRADMTAQIARIAGTRMAHIPRPLRLSYNGAVLRVKPDPLNPERQLMQVGAEMIGAASPDHDAELAVAALSALREAGAERMTIDLGIPRLLDTVMAAAPEELAHAVAAKDPVAVRSLAGDKADLLCRLMDLPMAGLEGLAEARQSLSPQLPDAAAAMLGDLLTVGRLIREAADFAEVTIDPLESRGFDYHHGIGFAIFAPGVRGELGRGGRYRTPSGGGREEESTGVTLYLERVLRAMPGLAAVERVYIPHAEGLRVLRQQADAGVNAVYGGRDASTAADQQAEALRLGCSHILVKGAITPLDR
ncbi:MAG: ATP phosphoribosyltransferase regulatory subunit [Candidatus Puniceispirillales bacterium]